ncbi:MAG: geranylgeranylglyceryl/heptaprenylglyceryl phosphate synthase [Candidatus Cloacimonetes bacterium]|nr:geranylgeranylglyceryl/heptaprenylglyceryl phosphate synthase [Candidatus Cloacimonadota bacterium]
MKDTTFKYLLDTIRDKSAFLCLIDPDKLEINQSIEVAQLYAENGADAILIGGSMMMNNWFSDTIKEIKKQVNIPLIIFPGIFNFVCPHADALLMLNMLSSRNPQVLINEQVRSAPLVYHSKLEVIPTAYLLIESGSLSSVQYMSHSFPIPRLKSDIAVAHSLAAQYMGQKLIYLEAGSGAVLQVPDEMIKAVKEHIDVPLIVGGGIRTPELAYEKATAGADIIVVGTALENIDNPLIIKEFADAIHKKK